MSRGITHKNHPAVSELGKKLCWLPAVEITLDDMLRCWLEDAEKDLRRNCIDGVWTLILQLRNLQEAVPESEWGPCEDVRRKLNAFLRRHFRRVADGRWVFKRPAHRMRSNRRDWARFFRDANRMAADRVRAEIAADRRYGRRGKPKQRLQRIVDEINACPPFGEPIGQASVEKVRELLRRGRGKRPYDKFAEDPNGWKD